MKGHHALIFIQQVIYFHSTRYCARHCKSIQGKERTYLHEAVERNGTTVSRYLLAEIHFFSSITTHWYIAKYKGVEECMWMDMQLCWWGHHKGSGEKEDSWSNTDTIPLLYNFNPTPDGGPDGPYAAIEGMPSFCHCGNKWVGWGEMPLSICDFTGKQNHMSWKWNLANADLYLSAQVENTLRTQDLEKAF